MQMNIIHANEHNEWELMPREWFGVFIFHIHILNFFFCPSGYSDVNIQQFKGDASTSIYADWVNGKKILET